MMNLTQEQVDIIEFIFERELKPPFKTSADKFKSKIYITNIDETVIAEYELFSKKMFLKIRPYYVNLRDKICLVLELPYNGLDWWAITKINLALWFEKELNLKIDTIWWT